MEQLISILEAEMNAPDFTRVNGNAAHFKARNMFVYFAIAHMGCRFTEIRDSLPVYTYPKTVYQVFRRQYFRRKEWDNVDLVNRIKKQLDGRKTKNIPIR